MSHPDSQEEQRMNHVVIIPPKGLRGVYEENRIWARQYRDANKKERFIVSMKSSTPAAALEATRKAVTLAKPTGEVIYAVGHGGAGVGQAGQVDFAPKMAFRVSQFLAFYDNASKKWVGPSIPQMKLDLEAAKKLRGRKRRDLEKAWCSNYIQSGCKKAQKQVREIDKLQPHYTELGKIFRAHPVKRIVLLTCNVANADSFLDELATDLGVRVRAYTERVVSQSRWVGSRKNTKIYMFLEGDAEGKGSNNERSDTELLPGVSWKKRKDGKPLAVR
jgi:hypothetical protein